MPILRIRDHECSASDDLTPENPARNVLAVEDNDITLQFLDQAMQRIGFAVNKANNGCEAWELFSRKHFDLIITDYQMPLMDGLSLIKRVRAITPLIPIILISGKEREEIGRLNTIPHINAFLPKPFNIQALNDTVKRICPIIGARISVNRSSIG